MAGGVYRDKEPLPYQRQIPLQLILWEYPRALKRFILTNFDQRELFNFPSNALFCILEVRQDFIRTVVRAFTKPWYKLSQQQDSRNYTQNGLVNFRFHT